MTRIQKTFHHKKVVSSDEEEEESDIEIEKDVIGNLPGKGKENAMV